MDLGLQNCTVTSIDLSWAVCVGVEGDLLLTVETPAVLRLPDGGRIAFDPVDRHTWATQLHRLVGQRIAAAEYGCDGTLTVAFFAAPPSQADGDDVNSSAELLFTRLTVPADPGFEAWDLSDASGPRYTAIPGGEVAVWGR